MKEVLKSLDPFDDNGDRIKENKISIHEAVEAIGTKIRDRLSHALKDLSLEHLVKAMRVELSGLQVWNYRLCHSDGAGGMVIRVCKITSCIPQ